MAQLRVSLRRPVALSIEADGTNTEPPDAFKLFPLGQVDTTKGLFLLTPEDAAACVARHVDYGNDLSIDWGHGVLKEDEGGEGHEQLAAGWIAGLEVRDDGLWAIGVTWTDKAAAAIRAREQRFYSPLFMVEDGHVVEILNCALTLMPATKGITPLVMSRTSGTPTRPTPAARPSGAPRTTPKKATRMNIKDCTKAELTALAEEAEKDAGDDESKKNFAAKIRSLAEAAEDDSDDDKNKPEATSDQVEASRIVAAAKKITGGKTASEIEGTLRAMSEGHGQATALSAKLNELTAQVEKLSSNEKRERVRKLIAAHATPGPDCKVTPAEVDDLVEWGVKDEAALTSYLKKKSPVVAASGGAKTPGQAGGAGGAGATGEEGLTPAELEFCRRSKLDPKKYLAAKRLDG